MPKGRTCGEINKSCKCETHGRLCSIIIDHADPETAAALERARDELREMGQDAWIHSEESEHYCNLCTIERKNAFPAGTLNDKLKAKYWVKKDRKERRRAKQAAKDRGYQMPQGSPITLSDAGEIAGSTEEE